MVSWLSRVDWIFYEHTNPGRHDPNPGWHDPNPGRQEVVGNSYTYDPNPNSNPNPNPYSNPKPNPNFSVLDHERLIGHVSEHRVAVRNHMHTPPNLPQEILNMYIGNVVW